MHLNRGCTDIPGNLDYDNRKRSNYSGRPGGYKCPEIFLFEGAGRGRESL